MTHWLKERSKFIFSAVTIIVLLATMVSNISVVSAEPVSDTHFKGTAIDAALSPTLSISDSCAGPVIYLTGGTTSRYTNNAVANGTTFDRTAWYSDAVGNGSTTAFSVGHGEPPPYDICVFRGVINGHIPLDWSWEQAHTFGGAGDRTYTGHLALIDGARVHNVEDGWHPRELPEFGNTGIMQMRNTYMTGIRDDAIENDDFMPGFIEDSLFDGVRTFLSEQNQSGGIPLTIGPNEDPYIRITRVYVRLHPTNINGTENPGRWFKWKPEGTVNHNLIITDSVFAINVIPKGGWSALNFPAGTTFQGTNYILWLGTPGQYEATIPPGVLFLEGQAALDKWNQVRNNWLTTHGYDPRPLDDFDPMDDPVIAPAITPISGHAGVAHATLSYMDGNGVVKTATADSNGNYSFKVPYNWSGTVTPSKPGYVFSPTQRTYVNVKTDQAGQDYTATPIYTFSGNAGTAGVMLSYTDGTLKTVTSQTDGSYSFTVLSGWNGTVTPSHPCFTFSPASYTYNSVTTNKLGQDYTATFNTGSGCADIDLTIGGTPQGSYGLAVSTSLRPSYAGLDSGPVRIESVNGKLIVAGLNEVGKNNGVASSSFQFMAMPSTLLSNKYVFPAYNNISLDEQLRFGNVGNADTTVTVTIGGNLMGSYLLHPSEQQRVNYAGVDSGPVVVEGSDPNVPIIAAIRDAWFNGTTLESFSQLMGLPSSLLSNKYVFPAYNNLNLDDQLRFGNVGNADTTVTVTVGGTVMGSYLLHPSEQQRVNYPVDNGPVVVEGSDPNVPIIAAIRSAWFNGPTMVESWVQLMGLPASQVSNKYVFPAYNNTNLSSQLRFGNIGNADTTVTVKIGGQVQGSYLLHPSEQKRVSYSLDTGPVVVEGSNPNVPIIAALRDALFVNGVVESFAQVMGLPASQLSDTFVLPAYNNVNLSEQLRFAVP